MESAGNAVGLSINDVTIYATTSLTADDSLAPMLADSLHVLKHGHIGVGLAELNN
jgi:hypothetical protein